VTLQTGDDRGDWTLRHMYLITSSGRSRAEPSIMPVFRTVDAKIDFVNMFIVGNVFKRF
jgi:hypothetical protein